MQLNKHKVATLNYTLKDEDGNIIDESKDGSFSYLHGANNIIPGLEKALEGKQAGDQINVVIEPKDAYGERNLEKIERVPKDMFPPDSEIKEGMQFEGQSAQGEPIIITVTAIEGDEVIIDGNHPMAGIQLNFEVDITDVRFASEEEIEHGHTHNQDGCGH